MEEPEIDQDTTGEQLKAKRNLLLQELLGNPTKLGLVTEIRLIDDRITQLTCQSVEKKKIEAR